MWKVKVNRQACGTPFLRELTQAVNDYKNGRSLGERISMDEIEMTVYDDWDVVGRYYYEGLERDIYAPLISIEGEDGPERLLSDDEIYGFIPLRGHEYRLKVRRIYLIEHPFYHYYELIAVLDDKLKPPIE